MSGDDLHARDVLEIAVLSDTGMVRRRNEDAVFADAALGLAILADGMGGYLAGHIASGMATTLLASSFTRCLQDAAADPAVLATPGQRLRDEIVAANLAIFNAAQSQPQYAGMGTTLVCTWFVAGRLLVAHVGDSRLYRWRDGQLAVLTRDHSWLQEQIDNGMISPQDARQAPNRNLVTRALGIEPSVEVEIGEFATQPDDILLLCSDGLNDMLDDVQIGELLRDYGQAPAQAAEKLIEQANLHGGRDNVSVIVIRVRENIAVTGRWWQRWLARLK